MKKEYAFEALNVYGVRSYWAASYPYKKIVMDAAKEYISNYPGHTARILENTNAKGSYTAPVWVSIATLGA